MSNRILNWKPSPHDPRDFKSTRAVKAPPAIDMPTKFKLDMNIPVYDQGNIGSCVANSACACFRYETAQLNKDFSFDPSRLFVYYNARLEQGWQDEDSGAYIRDGFKVMNKYGLSLEKVWPYKDTLTALTKTPSSEAYNNAKLSVVSKYARVDQTIISIKQVLLTGAAVSFGFNVYESFYGRWSDTAPFKMPVPKANEELLGGHAVTIVGYDDDQNSFIIQNSWGTEWGNNGLFLMPYSFIITDNADDFWCIDEIQLKNENTPDPTVDSVKLIKDLFRTEKELWAVKKPTLIRIGKLMGLPVDESKNFKYNFNIVYPALTNQ